MKRWQNRPRIIVVDTDNPQMDVQNVPKGATPTSHDDEQSDNNSDEVRMNRFDSSEESENEGENAILNDTKVENTISPTHQASSTPYEDPLLLTKREIINQDVKRVERIIKANEARVSSLVTICSFW